jgi:hypothetical protein
MVGRGDEPPYLAGVMCSHGGEEEKEKQEWVFDCGMLSLISVPQRSGTEAVCLACLWCDWECVMDDTQVHCMGDGME